MKVVNTNLMEVVEFTSSLTSIEKRYYDMDYNTLLKEAVYIQGYREDDKLIGISGVCRNYLIVFSIFHMVKKEYQRRGLGTRMTRDQMQWTKEHHIPCLISKVHPENAAIIKTYEKSGMPNAVRVGDFCYYVMPTTRWALPVKHLLFALIRIRHRLQEMHILRVRV